jgi:predicted ATPase/DNA-binding winged helix-turn-helix (wHTH) protein
VANREESRPGAGSLEATGGPDLAFGPFVLRRAAMQLLETGKAVNIGSRAFDLLTLLAERAGQVVSKADLIAHAWPNTIVEEVNLRVHIAALRKALGDGQHGMRYIASVAGRGYAFVTPVTSIAFVPVTRELPRLRRHNLPATLTRLLGRESQAQRVEALLQGRRFVSIVGPAGIGKTSLALCVGNRVVDRFAQGVWLVELANLRDTQDLVPAVAESVGFSLPAENAAPQLGTYLRPRSTLLILDNCEHMGTAVAELAVLLLKSAPGLHLLLTSREQIRAEGEWMLRLPPLELPPLDLPTSLTQSLESPAVQLFVERAIASQDSFELTSANVDQVVALCRRLDGLPVAIELAAARIDAYGVAGTLKLIEDHSFSQGGDPGALLPRHQAMSALLDWDYNLLTISEQAVFARLAVFRGGFLADWAFAIAATDADDRENRALFDTVASLTAKSLLMAHAGGEEVEFRMLQTTRDYAYGKLQGTDGERDARRRHAQLLRDFFDGIGPMRASYNRVDWHAIHARCMDDIRFALEWAFGADGDLPLAIELALQILDMCLQLGMVEEARKHVAKAVGLLPTVESIDSSLAIRLQVAHASLWQHDLADTFSSLPTFHATAAAALAAGTDLEPDQQVEIAGSMWLSAISSGNYPATLHWSIKVAQLAKVTANAEYALVAERMMASAQFYLGDLAHSLKSVNSVLAADTKNTRIAIKGMTPLDRRVTMGIIKARTLWIMGFADQAKELTEEIVLLARSDVPHALGQAICMAAAPLAFWTNDLASLRGWIDDGLAQTGRHRMAFWHDWMQQYDLLLRWRVQQAFEDGPPKLSIETAQQRDFFSTIEVSMLEESTVERVERGYVGWCAAEVQRARAVNILSAVGDVQADRAALLLDRASKTARAQGAFAWELRAATSSALLWLRLGNRDVALRCLAPVYQRVQEGKETSDVRLGGALMEALEGSAPGDSPEEMRGNAPLSVHGRRRIVLPSDLLQRSVHFVPQVSMDFL